MGPSRDLDKLTATEATLMRQPLGCLALVGFPKWEETVRAWLGLPLRRLVSG